MSDLPSIPPQYQEIGLVPGEDAWVFAYGSLMWRPGFPYAERHIATVRGLHRSFCVYSFRHRGTRARPGAVLGLDRGGSCRGMAYRIAAADAGPALEYLWEREMMNRVYRPQLVTVRWPGGSARAVAFVVVRGHEQYCGRLPQEELARLIRQGEGESGRNVDYLVNTVEHLVELGIRDRALESLVRAVGAGN
ncbi:MAG TPA: gamma-glutamylcyclotransferase [Azospirillaceae bacterium]|nr:gamma-glutamylcyclotransferase [Azospirillaceae bacterium]